MDIRQPIGGWTFADAPTSSDRNTSAEKPTDSHVLAPILTTDESKTADQLKIARTLAQATNMPVRVTSPTAPGHPSTTLAPTAHDDPDSDLSSELTDQLPRSSRSTGSGLVDVHRLTRTVHNTIAASNVDTVVVPGEAPTSLLAGDTSERIATQADCDVLIVNGTAGLDTVPSILLPITGGPHSGLAVDIARRLAVASDACLDVLHVVDTNASDRRYERAEAYIEAAEQRLDDLEGTRSWLLEADDPIDAITEQSDYYPLTVLGAPTTGRLQRFVSGSTNQAIRSNANNVVVSVYNNTGHPSLDDS
ncbi:universal stress protein UspA [Halalkaliarchaeum desulfuricum]|uniref:Universal stress protein UspA n=1 Tax=Halalkaliarchaeum desulfuricum TaxID=2055893 RepID=A0A343TJV0_9EURY|nr:universal stress protein [Halalkaliarchaeum desulfuricum]AUX09372.1 universal stress protein UspA [Halalkaliarchaeum desulfuricum]